MSAQTHNPATCPDPAHWGLGSGAVPACPSQDELADALASDLIALAGGSPARIDEIIDILTREETWKP